MCSGLVGRWGVVDVEGLLGATLGMLRYGHCIIRVDGNRGE